MCRGDNYLTWILFLPHYDFLIVIRYIYRGWRIRWTFFSGKYDYVHTEDWKTSLIAMEFCTFSNEQWMYIFAERFECFGNADCLLLYVSKQLLLKFACSCWYVADELVTVQLLARACFEFVFSNDALLYKNIFHFLEIKSGFHGHPLFVQNFIISYNPVKFIQVQIKICCRNDQCWNDVMKMIDDDFCGRYASKSAISLLAHVLKKCIAYNII